MEPKRKIEIPEITNAQWDDRAKAKIFEWLREYFTYRYMFGESIITYNEDFFLNAIKILQEEINGGEDNEG